MWIERENSRRAESFKVLYCECCFSRFFFDDFVKFLNSFQSMNVLLIMEKSLIEQNISEVPYSDQNFKKISIETDWNSGNLYSKWLKVLKIIIADHLSHNEIRKITISNELWSKNPLFAIFSEQVY